MLGTKIFSDDGGLFESVNTIMTSKAQLDSSLDELLSLVKDNQTFQKVISKIQSDSTKIKQNIISCVDTIEQQRLEMFQTVKAI